MSNNKSNNTRRNKKKKNLVFNILMVAAAIIFCFSAWKLFDIWNTYKLAENEYDKIAENVTLPEVIIPEEIEESETETMEEEDWNLIFLSLKELEALNSDFKGYIIVPNTKINYPIVQTSDNEYYLTHTFNRTQNASGTLFIDSNIPDGLDGRNPIVYGHNMNNGSMFAGLMDYQRQSFYDSNSLFMIYTKEGIRIYKVFAAYTTEPTSASYTYGFGSDESFTEYINKVKSLSEINTGVEVGSSDKIITLSTCTNKNDMRFVVHGKLISVTTNR